MAICGVLALVLGYLAGLRFRVAVVLPLEMAAGAVATGSTLFGQVGPGPACLGFLASSVALQVGYALALAYPLRLRVPVQRPPLKA